MWVAVRVGGAGLIAGGPIDGQVGSGCRAVIMLANDHPNVTVRFWRAGAKDGHEQWDVQPNDRQWEFTEYGVPPPRASPLPPSSSIHPVPREGMQGAGSSAASKPAWLYFCVHRPATLIQQTSFKRPPTWRHRPCRNSRQ